MENDKIIGRIEKLINGEIPNGKFELLRMYGAFERENAQNEIISAFRERVSNNIMEDIVVFSDKEAICTVRRRHFKDVVCYQPVILSNYTNVLCDTFEEAMVMLVCMKKDCMDAAPYIMKLMQKGN
ncbi:MAG: hypothetical protein IJZ79_02230 [Bacilli bacterium]|nr:hypothetical protein [Bacilli bacterium]